ncbi:MAG: hypothetical protein M3N31_04590 [Actinomycetota bacterium]|nr:hypothetical protein [Actinomycetota bacterium]
MYEPRRFINQSQPQTLYIAVFLLYIDAAFSLLFVLGRSGVFSLLSLAIAGAGVAAGFGIANEKRWGYWLGVAVAVLPLALRLFFFLSFGAPLTANLLSLMFEIALLALLLHPQSREYQSIWFK